MTNISFLRQAGQSLLDLVFPPHCLLCEQSGTQLCDDCCQNFPRVTFPICQLCGQMTDAPGVCGHCRRAPLAIDGIRSVLVFKDEVRKVVHEFKYGDRQTLAMVLARLMADYWWTDPMPVDLIVAVPLHTVRQRERGYNQSELLARELGSMIGLPILATGLKRVRHTPPQMSLNAAERRRNVQGAFVYQSPARDSVRAISNQGLLVIDDVCTTGSTLEACSLALKAAGAAAVWGFTLARA